MLFTRCTHCDAWLRLSAAQLRVAVGHVRCGSCHHVFNALVHLDDEPPVPGEAEGNHPVPLTDIDVEAERPGMSAAPDASGLSDGAVSPEQTALPDEPEPSEPMVGTAPGAVAPALPPMRFELFDEGAQGPSPDEAPLPGEAASPAAAESTVTAESVTASDHLAPIHDSPTHDSPTHDSPASEPPTAVAADSAPDGAPAPQTPGMDAQGVMVDPGAGDAGVRADDVAAAVEALPHALAEAEPDRFDTFPTASADALDAIAARDGPDRPEPAPGLAYESIHTATAEAIDARSSGPGPVAADPAAAGTAHTGPARSVATTSESPESGSAAPDPDETDLEVPAILRADVERIARQRSPWRRAGSVALASILVLAIGGQYVWFNPERAMRTWPALATGIERLCGFAGCKLPLADDRSVLRLVSREVRIHPAFEGALQVTAVIVNEGPRPQTYPGLRFILFNVNGNVIASRRFTPEEYLGARYIADLPMMPGKEAIIRLDLVAPEDTAVSFEFEFI